MMTAVSANIEPQLSVASPTAFERFGSLVPAGPVAEHLMDARIFRSIQNRVTPPEWIKQRDPEAERFHAAEWTATIDAAQMEIHDWERTIMIPDGTFDAILAVATRKEHRNNDISLFRLPPNCAVNILAGVAFSPLMTAEPSRSYWRIGDLAGLIIP